MSSLSVLHDLHLMMLEIAVENLFVPWNTEFDKIILKKTIVMFRLLGEEWILLSPNRCDYRSYRGSSYENEKFHGGRSVIFCVPASFFTKKTGSIEIQFYVLKTMSKRFEMDWCQKVGSVAVSVDDLLNGISRQIHERDEFAEHLSDFYKRQIISRFTMGTYTLLDENLQNTAATISLYIRISYLGKCVITEITCVKDIQESFYARAELDEEETYCLQQLTLENLQSGRWDGRSLPRIPRGQLICRCEELVKEELVKDLATNLRADVMTTSIADIVHDAAAIVTKRTAAVNEAAEYAMISTMKVAADDVAAIDTRKALADYGDLSNGTDANANTSMDPYKGIMASLMAIDDEATNGDQSDIRRERKDFIDSAKKRVRVDKANATFAVAIAAAKRKKVKGYMIKDDNVRTALKKAFFVSSKSKNRRNRTTIGIMERGERALAPSFSFSRLETYPLCCRLQSRPICFTYCYDVLPCYCHRTMYPFQFSHHI